MNLSDDILREIALKLDTQSIENLSSSSQLLRQQLKRLTTNEFWYTKFVEYTEPLINKQVSSSHQVSWKKALYHAISSTVHDVTSTEIDIQTFLPYAVTSLATVSLAEDMFGELDWTAASEDLTRFGSVEVVEAYLKKKASTTGNVLDNYIFSAIEGDNLEVALFLAGLFRLRTRMYIAAASHTTRILTYCRDIGLLTPKRALKILVTTTNLTVESLAVILPLIHAEPSKIYVLIRLAKDLISDSEGGLGYPPALEMVISALSSEGGTEELRLLLDSAISRAYDIDIISLLLTFVTPNLRNVRDAVGTQDDQVTELVISHLLTSVERTLARAIFVQDLKDMELLDRIREQEPYEARAVARAVLRQEDGPANSLLQAVFTALLYPEMSFKEIANRISPWIGDERDLADDLVGTLRD